MIMNFKKKEIVISNLFSRGLVLRYVFHKQFLVCFFGGPTVRRLIHFCM